jgi:hypothetical protein
LALRLDAPQNSTMAAIVSKELKPIFIENLHYLLLRSVFSK